MRSFSGLLGKPNDLPLLSCTLPMVCKFPNLKRIKHVDCPVYIIHGIRDEVIHVSHAHRMWDSVPNKCFPPYFVELAGHNNIVSYCRDYYKKINDFIHCVDHWVQKINKA